MICNTSAHLKPYFTPNLIEAGCDEAGRGCLAGPVFAAAVILPPDFKCEGLNDSKRLRPAKRAALRLLIEKDATAWAVASATGAEIDAINILRASLLAMHRAIDMLKVRPEHLLIDGNSFIPYPGIEHTTIVSGDALYMSIAAASILAKTHRDEHMEQLSREYPQYQWEKNKGYPTSEHRHAIKVYGKTPHHRQTFAVR
ncbi:MAG: ribonuclease HII [Tannerellaceae bacterium]|jgi:ribonuclease HII|nr:ribonuclease HII [Tannerellaceae bacterium]